MRTRFGLFCEGLLEGAWLIALIAAPLYFNFHTSNIFDPDKSSLIRALAILMIVIYLIRLMEPRTPHIASFWRIPPIKAMCGVHPIIITGLILGGCYLFSTIVSLTPHTSWWGSYARAQGAYTLLAYVVIFFITARTLRKQVQLERMITTIILTSFPIAIYGLSQPLRLDALPWGTDFTRRIGTTIGNPIFVGAYFIMVIPLTLVRLIHSLRHLLNQRRTKLSPRMVLPPPNAFGEALALTGGKKPLSGSRGMPTWASLSAYLLVFLYAFLLLLQIVCLVLTQSRGPLVGLIVGLFFFFVLTAILYQRKKLARLVYGLAILLVLFLVVLNLPQTPLEPLKKTPYLGRLGQVFETETGSGKVRLLIWEGIINMVKTGGLRNFIGFGPEMMAVLYYRHCPPELVRFEGRIAFPDRSHNELFDTLTSIGFLGTFVYLCFIGIIIFYVLKWLGLVRTRAQTRLFIILCVAGSVAGIILPRLLQGSYIFSAVGIPLGLVSAAALYILIALFQTPNLPAPTFAGAPAGGLILIGLASALIAHFIETQFGIAVTATRTYFWLLAAMLVPTGYLVGTKNLSALPQNAPANPVRGVLGRSSNREASNGAKEATSPSSTSLTFYALIIGFIASTVFYNLVPSLTNPPFNLVIVGEIVLILLFSVIFITAVGTGLVPVRLYGQPLPNEEAQVVLHRDPEVGPQWVSPFGKGLSLQRCLILFVLSAGYVIIFALILSLFLPPFRFLPPTSTVHLSVIPMFYLWVLLTIILLAWSTPHIRRHLGGASLALCAGSGRETIAELGKKSRRPASAGSGLKLIRWGNLIVYILLLGGGLIWISYSLIKPLQGNILYKRGSQSEKLKRWDESIAYYEQVIDRAADATYYYASIARVYMEKGYRETNPAKRAQIREQCKKYLLLSIKYEPLSPERNANLGRFYRKWASEETSDKTERQRLFQEAAKYYEQAHRLTPYNPRLLNEWGELYMDMRAYKQALEKYEASERLDNTFAETYAHLGDVYSTINNPPEASKYYEQAALLYLTTKERLRHPNQEILFIRTHENLIKYQPKNYLGYYNLARYYWGKRNHKRCLELAQPGRALAPPARQQVLDRYIKLIEATKK